MKKAIIAVILLIALCAVLVSCKGVNIGINFYVDGELYEGIRTKGEEEISMPKDPVKDGYVFQGWYWDEGTWTQPFTASSLLNQPVSEALSVYAYFISAEELASTRLISFETMGAGAVNPVRIKVGEFISEPQGLSRPGYYLVGWYREADFTTKWNFATDRVSSDMTLYAKWVSSSDMAGAEIIAGNMTVSGRNASIRIPNASETFSFSEHIVVSPYAVYGIYNDQACTDEIPSGIVNVNEGANVFYIMVTSGNGSNKSVYTADVYRRRMFSATYRYNNGTTDKVVPAEEDSLIAEEDPGSKTGYTFTGWGNWNFGSDTVSDNVILTAEWTANEYDVTFDSALGSAVEAVKVTYDEEYTWSVPERRGYTFLGWSDGERMLTDASGVSLSVWNAAENTAVVAVWEVIEYSVSYENLKGAANPNVVKYTVEDEITFAAVSKDGYTFVEWLDEGGSAIEGISKGSIGNRVISAVWELIGYTATFVADGVKVADIPFNVETVSVTEPEIPAKTGYTAEWEDYSFIARDITVNAVYTPVIYKIIYNVAGAYDVDTPVNTNPTSYTIEDVTITLVPASKTGYTFVKWTKDGEDITEIAQGSYGDITVTAVWQTVTYTLDMVMENDEGGYDGHYEGEENRTSFTVEDEFTFIEPICDIRGYEFKGWYTLKNDGDKVEGIALGTVGNKTYYARWQRSEYTIVYRNTENAVNGNPTSYNVESESITLVDPSKTGYTFAGWYSDSDLSQVADTTIATGSIGDLEFYAKWAIIVYDITYYNVDGLENPNPGTYTVEDVVSFAEVFKLGHTFGGFFKEEGFVTSVTGIAEGSIGDVAVYAKYTVNTYNVWLDGKDEADYTVSFDLSGASGSVASQHIVGDAALEYPAIPQRSGYLFGGWYQTEDCTGNAYDFTASVRSDITLYAKWIEIFNTAITIGDSVSVSIEGTTLHYYDFVPLVSGDISVTTTGAVDTFGYLYDGDGTLLRSNDDGSDGGNFLIKYNVTAGEKYTIAFRGYGKASGGESVLYLSGNNTVAAGGTAAESGIMREITFGTSFTLPVPEAREGYVFRGWADADGTMYTDAEGNSIRVFDKGEETVLVSSWEVDGFDIIFVTNGGTAVETVTIPRGGRVDINSFVTTRSGYSFLGWYLSASDSEPYNATVMPDYDFTLYVKWTAYALDPIKYDESILAATSLRGVTAEDFGATCFDNGGNQVEITVSMSTQTAGETATVRLTATSNGKTRTATIQNVRIYGEPTLTFDEGVTYFNLKDGLTADWFTASGTDTFGEATEIRFEIEGDYAAGDTVTVIIKSVDSAGNVTSGYVANVMVYGLPVITYNEEKGEISVNDVLSAELLTATAVDSFGEEVAVAVTLTNGTIATGNTVTLTLTATDKYGNTTVINKDFAVYGMPTISNAETLEFRVEDEITPEFLGITARDTYDAALDISLAVKEGMQSAGVTMIWTATVTDIAGNVTIKDYSVRIYGTPVITYDRDAVKVTEDATVVNGAEKYLNAYAYDSFGNKLTLTASVSGGELAGGGHIAYTLTAVDHLGNTGTITTAAIPVYDVADIELSYDAFSASNIKLTSTGEEFTASATDSFGEACVITVERAGGGAIVAGEDQNIVIVATDRAGNRYVSETVSGIKVYGMPTAALTYPDNGYTVSENDDISFLFIVRDSFGEEIYAEIASDAPLVAGNTVNITVTATDDAGNVFESTYLFGVLPAEDPFVTLMVNDALWQSLFVTDNVLPLPTVPDDGMVFYGWFDGNGIRFTDEAGNLLVTPDEYVVLYARFYPEGYTPITTAEELKNISLDGKYILLNDIDLGGAEWTPIGTKEDPFTGELNGNGYTVSNFKITTGRAYVGLFGYNKGVIKNLGVENFTVNVSYSGNVYAGGLVGYNNSGDITNSYATGDVSATSSDSHAYAGGLVGYNDSGDITNSYAAGNVSATSSRYSAYAGGLVGSNSGGITNSYATGEVSATSTYSYYSAYAGGLVGYNNSGDITNSYATGNVSATASSTYSYYSAHAGGLVGYNSGDITNSYAAGNVSATSTGSSSSASARAYAGGLVGYNSGSILNSYATGEVSATATTASDSYARAGGLVGENYYGSILNSYATGDVSASSYFYAYAGGLVGYNSGGSITNSYATGNVSATGSSNAYAGGLVGSNSSGDITNCYRYSGQTFYRKKGSDTYSTASNTLGTEEDLTTLQSVLFHTSTLGWDESVWNFVEGAFPTLKNAGTAIAR